MPTKKVRSSTSKSPRPTSKTPLDAILKKLDIDPARVRDHVMRPAHIMNVASDTGPVESPSEVRAPSQEDSKSKHLDAESFGSGLHAALKDNVIGYCMRLRKHGKTIVKRDWHWAQTEEDDSLVWNPNRSMHVASVSKLITAIAMTKLLLDHKKISAESKIVDHLPAYWVKGQNIDKITFRHLLTHTSGFSANGQLDYETMKGIVQLGVSLGPPFDTHLGKYSYENMNFGLCRILIPIINGDVDKNILVADNAWDLLTIISYEMYVATHVFGPAGVGNATLDHPPKSALAYYFPPSGDGWDSGNLMTASGGAGWHLSVNDLLKVMGAFRRNGTIMTRTQAQWLLDNKFGIDVVQDTPAGRLYEKNGLWRSGPEGVARVEQAVAYFLPEDMEMAVFVNSYVDVPAKDLQSLVTQEYLAHLK